MSKTRFHRGFALCLAALLASAATGQEPAAQKQPKNQQEYDLIMSAQKAANPAQKLQLLDQWTKEFPDSAYKEDRLKQYMTTYQAAGQPAKAIGSAKEVLALVPGDFGANLTIASIGPFMNSAEPQLLSDVEKASQDLLKAQKPEIVKDADWAALQKTGQFIAHQGLGWVPMQRKQNAAAEEHFIKAIEINPSVPMVSYWLGTSVLAQQNPDKYPMALFAMARASSYDGEGALPAQFRQQVDAFLARTYKNYHGEDPAGLAELKQLAKVNPLPPSDLKIKSAAEIANDKEEALKKDNPKLAMFLQIKAGLTGADSATFWGGMKGTAMPSLRGTVIAAKPGLRPKTVELALSQSQTAEVTLLTPETAAKCQIDPGAQIEFEGAEAVDFAPNPFMIKMQGGKITSGCVEPPPPAKTSVTKKGGATRKK